MINAVDVKSGEVVAAQEKPIHAGLHRDVVRDNPGIRNLSGTRSLRCTACKESPRAFRNREFVRLSKAGRNRQYAEERIGETNKLQAAAAIQRHRRVWPCVVPV